MLSPVDLYVSLRFTIVNDSRTRWACFDAFLCGLLLACACRCAVAQVPPRAEAYSLRYVEAEQARSLLLPLIAQRGGADISVDPRGQQLLVAGSAEVQALVRQTLTAIDVPGAGLSGSPVVRRYHTAGAPDQIVAALSPQFAARTDVGMTVDPNTGELVVVASEAVQAEVHRQINGAAGRGQNAGIVPDAANQPGELDTPPRFVQLRHARSAQIEPLLVEMLAARLQPVDEAVAGLPGYVVHDAGGEHVMLGLNRAYDQVVVRGNEPLAGQVLRLVEMLDSPRQPAGRAIRIVPLERAHLRKVRRAMDAYRGSEADPSQSSLNSVGRAERLAMRPGTTGGPLGFAGMLFGQVPAAAGEEQDDQSESPGPLGADVEVEVLPDLDIIILRGDERDVEEVLRIIEEIERVSAEEEPVIEVYTLRHVGNQGVAEVIEQVNEALLASRQGRVLVTPLVTPNAVLIIGRGQAVEVVKDLLGKLDQPADPKTQARVFRLQHAVAATVATTIEDFFGEPPVGLAPRVLATADVRSNSVVVHANPNDMQEVALIVERLDVPDSRAVNQLQVFHLKNTLAADLGPVLQDAISGTDNATNQRSNVLEFFTIDGTGERLLESGVLSDVRITPDPRTNTLLVSAPAESMELLAALIDHLDALPAAVAQIKVFKILHGDAASLVQMLETLLGTAPGSAQVQLPRAEAESSLAPLRFSVDTRTNSIIASGSSGDLTIVEAILLRLDEEDIENRRSTVYRLKNAPAIDVAISINEFLRSERQVQQAAPGTISPFRQIESEVVVVPEPVSNALIISATPRFYDEIMELVEKLDEQPPQVLIQVLIAEVQLNNTDEFGIELGLQDSVLFDRSLLGDLLTITQSAATPGTGVVTENQVIVGATNTPGYNFNNTPLGNSGATSALARSATIGTQGLSNFAVGRLNTELGYGGLVLSASSESVSALLRALRENRRLDVLSRPQIMTLDNQPAFIQVGQRVPRITGTTINQFSQVNTIALENVGLILGVTPRISPEGMVVMEIDAEKSSLGPDAEGIPVASSSTGEVIRSPRINTTTAQTTVSAASGQTIVLGGLITKERAQVSRRVPLLSDIPLLGHLFRYDGTQSERTELLIILTPHVVRDEYDADRLRAIEASRMSWCLADVVRLHEDGSVCQRGDCEHCRMGGEVIYPDGVPAEVLEQGMPVEVLPGGPSLPAPHRAPLMVPTPTDQLPPQGQQSAPPLNPQSPAAPVVQPAMHLPPPQAGYVPRG